MIDNVERNRDIVEGEVDEKLWESVDLNVAVLAPHEAAIPSEEGTHIQVLPHDTMITADWRTGSMNEVLREGFFALGVSRSVVESGRTDDAWANIHWNSRFEQGANVFGRKPSSESGWAKPVVIREQPVPAEPQPDLQKFVEHYLGQWENFIEKIRLFEDGVHELSPDSDAFQEEVEKYRTKPDPWQESALWANDKFVLVAVNNPHLNGVHLVVHPREKYWNDKGGFKSPWQRGELEAGKEQLTYIEGFLESVAVLKAAQEMLAAQEDIKFANPEIHYSGNWAKGLLSQDKGGKFDQAAFEQALADGDPRAVRDEKLRYVPGKPEDFNTSMHGHLYATESAAEFVTLPTRPKAEVPDQWSHIKPMDPATIEKLSVMFQKELTQRLEQAARGSLVENKQGYLV